MISFIIIGRNEGWNLSKCLESVFNAVEFNSISDYEVIYVDSQSTDDSIARAKKFGETKVFQLTGDYNAAIARNVGAKESKGDVLFFIDGDMEIQAAFLPLVYTEKNGLIYDFVSGQFLNYYYDKNKKNLSNEYYHKFNKNRDKYQTTTGGLFFIKKEIWLEVNGMKNKYRRSQDIDFGLRLAKKGIFLHRKKELLAYHNTIYYMDSKRMWNMLFCGDQLYRSVLYRDHIFNKHIYKLLLRNDYTFVLLLFVFIIIIFVKIFYVLNIYFFVIFLRALFQKNISLLKFINNVCYYFLRDLSILAGILIFYPKNTRKLKY